MFNDDFKKTYWYIEEQSERLVKIVQYKNEKEQYLINQSLQLSNCDNLRFKIKKI